MKKKKSEPMQNEPYVWKVLNIGAYKFVKGSSILSLEKNEKLPESFPTKMYHVIREYHYLKSKPI